MEFLRKILAEQEGAGDSADSVDELDRALEASQVTAQKMWAVALDGAKPFIEKGEYMGASIVIMSAVWQALDMAKQGTNKTAEAHGQSAVSTVWAMFEATFMSESAEEARAKLDAIRDARKKK